MGQGLQRRQPDSAATWDARVAVVLGRNDEFAAGQHQPIDVSADQIRVGDKLGASLKTRIHTVADRGDHVLYAHRTLGTRSGSIGKLAKDGSTLRVWRKPDVS